MCDFNIRFKSNGIRITKIIIQIDYYEYSLDANCGLNFENCQQHKIHSIIEKLLKVDNEIRQTISFKILNMLQRLTNVIENSQVYETINKLCGVFIYTYCHSSLFECNTSNSFDLSIFIQDLKNCQNFYHFFDFMKTFPSRLDLDILLEFRNKTTPQIQLLIDGFEFAKLYNIEIIKKQMNKRYIY